MGETVKALPSVEKRWLKVYTQCKPDEVDSGCSIFEYMRQHNQEYSNDIALRYIDRNITYGEMFERIDDCARALIAYGIEPGDVVTMAMVNIPEMIYLLYAINKIGAIVNMVHPLASTNELKEYLNEMQSKVFIMFTGTYDFVKSILDDTYVKTAVVVSPSQSFHLPLKILYQMKLKKNPVANDKRIISWQTFMENGRYVTLFPYQRDCDQTAVICHTGGTTGSSKGVMLSDRNINTNAYQTLYNMPWSRDQVYMAVLPPFITYSLVHSMLVPLSHGMRVVLIPKYDPFKFVKYMKWYRPSVLLTIPPYLDALLKLPEAERLDCSSLQYIYYGGEAMSKDQQMSINKLLKSHGSKGTISQGYGATELTGAVAQGSGNSEEDSSIFPLLAVDCMIVSDEDGETELSYNQEGEVCFAGPTVMLGYYNNQEETDQVIKIHRGQRWYHTGDLGYLDEDGRLVITGRLKRLMLTVGDDGLPSKLFPDRIEQVLNHYDGVTVSCVVGILDEITDVCRPKAYIELADYGLAGESLRDSILAFCRERLPLYQVPVEIEFVKELLRTSRGKVDYRQLEQQVNS